MRSGDRLFECYQMISDDRSSSLTAEGTERFSDLAKKTVMIWIETIDQTFEVDHGGCWT
jgi:hypothetical protein